MIPAQTLAGFDPRKRLIPGVGMPGLRPPGAAPATMTPDAGFRPPTGVPGSDPMAPNPVSAGSPALHFPTGPVNPSVGLLGRFRDMLPTGAGGPTAQPVASGAAMPAATPASTPLPQTTTLGYGTLGKIDPNNDLRSQVIAPGAESNRADLAKSYLDTWSQNELPQFRAALRGTYQDNAALGRTGSGMLRTDVGNLDLAEQQKYNTAASNFFTDALGNQITDNANQRAELRGERAYQTSAEQSAADRARQGILDSDYLTNSRFGRAATQTQLGMAGNPAGVIAGAAADAGNRAAAGARSVGDALGSSTYADLLRKILAQQGGVKPTGTVPVPIPQDYGMIS